jgi:opacity protein-like surface antigen
MKRAIGPILISAVLLAGAAQAHAQVGLYVGGYLGYSAQKPSFQDVQFTTDSTLVYGFRGGIKFLMLALEINYFSAMHNIAMSDFLQFNWNDRVNDYSFIGLNLKYIFPILFLEPYLTVGYGYYTADIRDIDKDKEGGYNAGVGVEVRLGKKIALQAEGKYHHVKVDISKFSITLGDFTVCGGVNYHF